MQKTVLTDYRVPGICSEQLAAIGFAVVRLPCFEGLDAPVCAHPDLLTHILPGGRLLVDPVYYAENRALFDALSCTVVLSRRALRGKYPDDVIFDALTVNNRVYGKQSAVAEELLCAYPRFVPVRQGYANCAVALLNDKNAVTADEGLAAALMRDGLRVLRIRPGFISLPGYDTGFIGGAGGRLDDRRYVFFGSPDTHPDGERIRCFAEECGVELLILAPNQPLTDYGGLTVI